MKAKTRGRRKPLEEALAAGKIVTLSREEWERLSKSFTLVEEHDTSVAGKLLIVRGRHGLAAVESPEPELRVIRPLRDEQAAEAFVRQRLEAYDRMWDGCGCKVDYYH